jgi:hypothetical protein
MKTPRFAAQLLAVGAAAAMLAACGSTTSTTTKPPTSTSTTTPPASSAVTATITKNWETFFDAAKTPINTRISLLENGTQFPKSSLEAKGIAADASAKVLSVTNVTASTASVKYNVLLAGTPALKDQSGTAVYQDGTWKVGTASFCGLLTLEKSSGFITSLPSACSSGA